MSRLDETDPPPGLAAGPGRVLALASAALLLVLGCLAPGCVNLDRPSVGTPDAAVDLPGAEGGPAADMDPGEDGPGADADPDAGDTDPTDVDLPPDQAPPVDMPPDAPPLINGRACSAGPQCESSQCVDGVCCESSCAGACQTCNRAGSEGRCLLVPAGEDPGNECPQDPVAGCQRDGTCNGAGACRVYAAGIECAAGRCQGTTEFAASTCDGSGSCKAGSSRTCPGGATCNGTSCGSSCASDAACQTGFFCDLGVCRTRRSTGAACASPGQCASGFCMDGVCCSTACTENCHACNVGGAAGTCTPVPDGQDPRSVCAADPVASCARNGACDGKGSCKLYPAGTSCGAAACSGAIETPAPSCNGLGTCTASAARDCGAYTCGSSTCATSCSNGSQCNPGYACAGSACQPLGGLVLYWRLDDPSGTTAVDSSGNNRNGTYTGVNGIPIPSSQVPPVGFSDPGSRQFDMSGRHAVRLAAMPAALKPTTALTISAWYRANQVDIGENTDSSEIVSGGDTYILRVRVDGFEFSVATSAGYQKCLTGVTGHLDNNWHHVAGVLSATGLKTYYDGVERGSVAGSFTISYAQGPDFWVGRHGNGDTPYDYNGHIDDVRVYNRSLSPAEVLRLAQGKSQL
jgi:hypothetical protein